MRMQARAQLELDQFAVPLAGNGCGLFGASIPDALFKLLGIVTESTGQQHKGALCHAGGDLRAAQVDDGS